MDEKVVLNMHCNQIEENKANKQIIKIIKHHCRAEILLGEKEETREELVKELRRLVHNEDNLSVPQVVSQESFFIKGNDYCCHKRLYTRRTTSPYLRL